jgi:hypothetical protein
LGGASFKYVSIITGVRTQIADLDFHAIDQATARTRLLQMILRAHARDDPDLGRAVALDQTLRPEIRDHPFFDRLRAWGCAGRQDLDRSHRVLTEHIVRQADDAIEHRRHHERRRDLLA